MLTSSRLKADDGKILQAELNTNYDMANLTEVIVEKLIKYMNIRREDTKIALDYKLNQLRYDVRKPNKIGNNIVYFKLKAILGDIKGYKRRNAVTCVFIRNQ